MMEELVKPYIEVQIKFLEGSRKKLPLNGYRPDIVIEKKAEYWGVTFVELKISEFNKWMAAKMKFTFWDCHYKEIKVGQLFSVMEGPHKVAEGKIIALKV